MKRDRIRQDIDGHSYLETYHDPEIKVVLVFVHGILGDHIETWKSTPTQLMTSRILVEADWASFGYNTGFIDFSSASFIVDQFILWAKTHLAQYESIFVVAHSMGGLIVRDALTELLRRGKQPDKELFSAVKHCFLVAVPVSGSAAAGWIGWIPGAAWLNRKIGYLAPAVDVPRELSRYAKTTALAKEQKIPRPTFSLFVGTSDVLVKPPEARDLSPDDDTYEGPVPGSHDTIKADLTANSTLVKRIIEVINEFQVRDTGIKKSQIALQPQLDARTSPARESAASERSAAGRGERDVVLISCSYSKDSQNGQFHQAVPSIVGMVAHEQIGTLLLRTRVKIMTLIQQGMLQGIEFKEGNRAARRENKELRLGPDFGGAINEPRYLPAYRRYTGRFYQATPEEWQGFFARGDDGPDILVMSALYGLYPVGEHIQQYDCHITDIDKASGLTLRSHWGDLMTDTLLSHFDWLEQQGWKIGRVIDLLSERSYQFAINWQRIYPRARVLHRVFERRAGRDTLENLGIWFRKVVREPQRLAALQADMFYADPDFLADPDSPVKDRIAFETRLGESSLVVAREQA